MKARRERQRAEILGLIAVHDLHRAADPTHEHLADFPDDRDLQRAVVAALDACTDSRLRRRVAELPST